MSDKDIVDLLTELIEINRENQQWLRLAARDNAKEAITDALDEPWEYHFYDALDGDTKTTTIVPDIPCSKRTLNNRLSEWSKIGIVERVSRSKYEKILSLDVIGIEKPKIEKDNK